MNHISIVIITKNEGHILERTLNSTRGISNDIIIVDSGSTDDTLAIAARHTSRIVQTTWLGYGATKNLGIEMATCNWILTMDADEALDEELRQNIMQTDIAKNETVIYTARFKNFIGEKQLIFGKYLKSTSVILFNRKYIKWDDQPVHEKLIIPKSFTHKKLKGSILHYSMKDLDDFKDKIIATR